MTDRKIEKKMEEDLQKKYGALVSVTDLREYFGIGKTKAQALVSGLRSFGEGTGKRYFYMDVIEKVMK